MDVQLATFRLHRITIEVVPLTKAGTYLYVPSIITCIYIVSVSSKLASSFTSMQLRVDCRISFLSLLRLFKTPITVANQCLMSHSQGLGHNSGLCCMYAGCDHKWTQLCPISMEHMQCYYLTAASALRPNFRPRDRRPCSKFLAAIDPTPHATFNVQIREIPTCIRPLLAV